MPQPERSHRPHWVVVWFAAGTPDRHGQARVTDEPVELRCRFDNTVKEVPTAQGGSVKIEGSACQLDRDVPVKSVFWVGRLADLLVGTAYDLADGPLYTVEFFNRQDDLRKRPGGVYREVQGSRYRGSLPPLKVG